MADVFWGFSIVSLVGLQQMDFGLGLAIWLDATIFWCIMAPAFMTLRGKWNWYLPRWMERIPNVRFGPSDDAPVAARLDD